jgi:hypothetical protein
MKIGTEMGGLEQEEHDGLIAALKKEGWHLRYLNVELMEGLVTGLVTLQIVQEKAWEAYKTTYLPLENSEYRKVFIYNQDPWNKKK